MRVLLEIGTWVSDMSLDSCGQIRMSRRSMAEFNAHQRRTGVEV